MDLKTLKAVIPIKHITEKIFYLFLRDGTGFAHYIQLGTFLNAFLMPSSHNDSHSISGLHDVAS